MTQPDYRTPTKSVDLTIKVDLYEGMGPMSLRENLAGGKTGEYGVEWSRMIPMGLHATVRKGDRAIGTAVVTERQVFEAISELVIRQFGEERKEVESSGEDTAASG